MPWNHHKWQNRKERLNRNTNNGDMAETEKPPVREWVCDKLFCDIYVIRKNSWDRGGGGVSVVKKKVWVRAPISFNKGLILKIQTLGASPFFLLLQTHTHTHTHTYTMHYRKRAKRSWEKPICRWPAPPFFTTPLITNFLVAKLLYKSKCRPSVRMSTTFRGYRSNFLCRFPS